jgi:hypothetical protein
MTSELIQWLLESDEPWTRYRTLVDLLDRPEDDAEVQAARAEMVAHGRVQALIGEAAAWPGYALKRHNDGQSNDAIPLLRMHPSRPATILARTCYLACER